MVQSLKLKKLKKIELSKFTRKLELIDKIQFFFQFIVLSKISLCRTEPSQRDNIEIEIF